MADIGKLTVGKQVWVQTHECRSQKGEIVRILEEGSKLYVQVEGELVEMNVWDAQVTVRITEGTDKEVLYGVGPGAISNREE